MRIHTATLETCAEARGVVVIIDVIRAFTTAAFALAAGAPEIVPVGAVAEARALRERWPEALLMGEVGGLPPAGFDYGNSPSALVGLDLSGRRLIQRTGAGTQGLVRSRNAEVLLASSFVCAGATIRYLRALGAATVTLVPTDTHGEDRALAEYLTAALPGPAPDPAPYLERVRAAGLTRIQAGPDDQHWPEWAVRQFLADLDLCVALDRFDFTLRGQRRDGSLVLAPISA
jgi:2-phosphosulfolactate phosphatase